MGKLRPRDLPRQADSAGPEHRPAAGWPGPILAVGPWRVTDLPEPQRLHLRKGNSRRVPSVGRQRGLNSHLHVAQAKPGTHGCSGPGWELGLYPEHSPSCQRAGSLLPAGLCRASVSWPPVVSGREHDTRATGQLGTRAATGPSLGFSHFYLALLQVPQGLGTGCSRLRGVAICSWDGQTDGTSPGTAEAHSPGRCRLGGPARPSAAAPPSGAPGTGERALRPVPAILLGGPLPTQLQILRSLRAGTGAATSQPVPSQGLTRGRCSLLKTECIQLTLQQLRFEPCGSTHMWVFFRKYHSSSQAMVGGICGCRTTATESRL